MKKVWFVDYWCEDTTKGNFILDMLPDGYVVSNENPDIVFSFCNDNAFKSYNNAIKIQVISQEAFYFENLHEFDYVVGFNDDERHIYIPYWTATWSDYLKSGCSASN